MAVGDFSSAHKLLSVFGTAFGTETWSFGIRIEPVLGVDTPLPTQAQADACAALALAWWNNVNTPFGTSTVLQGVKLAPIAVNGHYPPTGISYIGDVNPDDAGAISTNIHPPQCALVATLLSATIPRGRGHSGRIYLPAPALSISSSGNMGDMTALFATPLTTFVQGLNNSALLGNCVIMSRESVKAGVTLPAQSSFVGSIRVGNVMDTQRRRRRSIVETRYTGAAITT